MAMHSSILAWRIPMDRGAWWSIVHRVAKSWTQLRQLSTHALFCLQNEQNSLSRVHLGVGSGGDVSLTSTSCFLLFCQEKCVWWRIKWEHWSPCKPGGGCLGEHPRLLCAGATGQESRVVGRASTLPSWVLGLFNQ